MKRSLREAPTWTNRLAVRDASGKPVSVAGPLKDSDDDARRNEPTEPTLGDAGPGDGLGDPLVQVPLGGWRFASVRQSIERMPAHARASS